MASLNLNFGSSSFWQDVTTSEYLFKIHFALIFIAMVASTFVIVNIFGQNQPALIFTIFGIISAMVMIYESLKPNGLLLNFYSLGNNTRNALLAVVVGLVGAYLLLSNFLGGLFSVIPIPYTVIAPTVQWIWIWQVFFSPILEASFFRGFLFPSLKGWLNNAWIAAIVASIAFGLFHFSAKGGNTSLLFGAFVFSLAMIFFNQVFKSIGFEFGYHFMNNFLAFG